MAENIDEPSWLTDADAAYTEAARRIEKARQTGAEELSLKSISALRRLPALKGLDNVEVLDLSHTKIFDLSPIIELKKLRVLDIKDTSVAELTALVGLKGIQDLNLGKTPVVDLSPIAGLTSLQILDCAATEVSNLLPLGKLTALESLNLSDMPISEISAIAALTAMQDLNLASTSVSDLSALIRLTNLRYLNFNVTEVSDLAPLQKLNKLKTIALAGTKVSELSPLASLPTLQDLSISRTRINSLLPLEKLTTLRSLQLNASLVSDLLPIAGLEALVTGALFGGGLHFMDCPLTDPLLLDLAKKDNPGRTRETIAYLRRQRNMPPLEDYDVEENEIFDWQESLDKFKQNPLGAEFETVGDFLTISSSGHQTDLAAASDRITRQLHEKVASKSSDLQKCAARLSNQPGWQELAEASNRFSTLTHFEVETVADQIGLVWAELVSLGSFLELDEELKTNKDALITPLEPDVRRALADVIQTASPWVRRFPTARKLDDEYASFRAPRDRIIDAQSLLSSAVKAKIISGGDASILDAALKAADRSGRQSEKVRGWSNVSTRNLAIKLVTVASIAVSLTPYLVKGVVFEIGKELAADSALVKKAVRVIQDGEEPLRRFLSDLPADMRALVKALIESLRGENGFPIPEPPKPRPEIPPIRRLGRKP